MHGHEADAQKWGELEDRWSSLLGPSAGSAFGVVLCLIFVPLPAMLTLAVAAVLWFGIGLLCWFGHEADWCRQWRRYHAALADNPVAWPWPRMPGDA